MTHLQKQIFWVLFNGGHIVQTSGDKRTVRRANGDPVARFGHKTFYHVKKYCKKITKSKIQMYVLDKKKVLSLNGNNWVKKEYKAVRPQSVRVKLVFKPGFFCEPCPPMSVQKFQSQ